MELTGIDQVLIGNAGMVDIVHRTGEYYGSQFGIGKHGLK